MPKLEAKAANRILLLALLLAASYTLMRTVGDSLFLSRIGTDSLAAVFVLSGITTAAIASLWFALTRRFSLAISVRVSGLLFASLTIAAWFALPQLHHSWWLLAGIYLLTEIKGCVYAINVVTATNELLGGHSSRQAWARIGLGAPLAGIIFGHFNRHDPVRHVEGRGNGLSRSSDVSSLVQRDPAHCRYHQQSNHGTNQLFAF